ncbi:MAG: hypothetical protein JWO38_6176 [Gemmataceae bacterium]|nr:hypothetical protein [Gemmataceae bacterium]
MPSPSKEYANEVLIRCLARGDTIPDAARAARVGESTVYRRLRDPAFRDRVFEIRAAVLDTTCGRIVGATTDACDTLHHLLESSSEGIQLRAAKTLIELAVKLCDRVPHAESSDPTETPPAKTDSLSPTTPATQATGPQEPDPVRSEPIDSSRPVTPGPEVAAKQEERPASPDAASEPVISPASGDGNAGSAREPRPVDLTPSLLVTGEGDRPNKSARNLSNPVKTCHRPAGRLPVSEVSRLSAGLTVALAGVGGE